MKEINPHVLTMERRVNFYEQKQVSIIENERNNGNNNANGINVNSKYKQKIGKRILTTPTQGMKRQLKFSTY